MYPDWQSVSLVVIVLLGGWLAVLTWMTWRSSRFLRRLFPKTGKDLEDKLEEVLTEIAGLESFKAESKRYLQKVALKRYNPYQDTGGDQSFSVAFLDGHGNGVVVSSLHSRAGTRVFAKPVKLGGEDNLQFSEEEKIVVAEAVKAV